MKINAGFDLDANLETLEFKYGPNVFGPITEKRYLDDIRPSLSDPNVEGPEIVYSVAMDVGKKEHLQDLKQRNLLYGAMIFEQGIVGEEPVRSQGHVHAISPSCGYSTCEVYEIWSGSAYIYMQEKDTDEAGKCYAIYAKEGEVVIVPPNWVHATINADIEKPMLFGAWCVRDYGFDYKGVRSHKGIAYFPKVRNGKIIFESNPNYLESSLEIKNARNYNDFNLKTGIPIYTQYERNHELFEFVYHPNVYDWTQYQP